ncbi:MAG: RluA family pseudouridine synthase [Nitrospira sp.]|nr:RluA family pseudouridine synthase [Candidatus Manganitrophaceae bacterium]HIL34265.1 RluA family pseudouridine synthase [Candidatus Manganitrophaceae bacterium]
MSSFPPSPLLVSSHSRTDRLDLYLIKRGVPLSRARIQKLISEGLIRLNGAPTKASFRVREGDQIEICIPPPEPLELIPEEIPLDLLYEDDSLLIVNKPAGMVVHPAPGHDQGTLVHALLHHCRDLPGIGGRERPGIVHRLDKDTSGVMVVAKTDLAHQRLSKQFKDHSIARCYLALVSGIIRKKEGRIILAIGRDRADRKKISARTAHPRASETGFIVRERLKEATLLELIPQTGRTHQIRVHMAHLGHPVLGDKVYGGKQAGKCGVPCERQMLHAALLGFVHPVSREEMNFSAPIPPDMQSVLEMLRSLK